MDRWSLCDFQKHYNDWVEKFGKNEEIIRMFLSINRNSLPMFFLNKILKFNDLDELFLKNTKGRCPKIYVPLTKIYSDKWLFKDEFNGIDRRPDLDRLASLLTTKPDTTYPPIPLIELPNECYYAGDGNHRIYARYLLGHDTVLAYITSRYILPLDSNNF